MYKVCQYDDFHIDYVRCFVFYSRQEFEDYFIKNSITIEEFITTHEGWIETPFEYTLEFAKQGIREYKEALLQMA